MYLTVISFLVSVPVLSVQMTLVEPSVSTDESFLMTALCPARRATPFDNATVICMGRACGTTPTAMPRPYTSASPSPNPCQLATKNRTTPIPMARTVILLAMYWISSCRGDFDFRSPWAIPAILPTSVFIPVARTMPRPLPAATVVPRKAMLSRSASDDFFANGLLCLS